MRATYATFKDRVVEGRGDKLTLPIEQVAGGRVYTGPQAQERGLVDELGGLDEAVAHAASLAGLEEDAYRVQVLPRMQGFWETFMQALQGTEERPSDLEFDSTKRAQSATVRWALNRQTPPR